jgi:hypothetical protein
MADNMKLPKAHGLLTAEVARVLATTLTEQGYNVFCGHGKATPGTPNATGKLRVWYGPTIGNPSLLADLDIAVVERASNHAILLAEIEETSDQPKVLIGDAIAALLGSGVSFQGHPLQVGAWTTLIVLAHLDGTPHAARFAFLQEQVTALKAKLSTPNAGFGRVVLAGYRDAGELPKVLLRCVRPGKGP